MKVDRPVTGLASASYRSDLCFKIVLLKITQCTYMVDFPRPGHIAIYCDHISLSLGWSYILIPLIISQVI